MVHYRIVVSDAKDIFESLYKLKNISQLSDRSILVGKEEFKVHDVIIAIHSNFYRRAIEKQNEKSNILLPKNSVTEESMFDLIHLINERAVFTLNIEEFKAAVKYFEVENVAQRGNEFYLSRNVVDLFASTSKILDMDLNADVTCTVQDGEMILPVDIHKAILFLHCDDNISLTKQKSYEKTIIPYKKSEHVTYDAMIAFRELLYNGAVTTNSNLDRLLLDFSVRNCKSGNSININSIKREQREF